jgi:hypothetical protein
VEKVQGLIDRLSSNVATLSNKTSSIQREQKNVNKMLSIVEAALHFHSKVPEFEAMVRDEGVTNNPYEYIEVFNI